MQKLKDKPIYLGALRSINVSDYSSEIQSLLGSEVRAGSLVWNMNLCEKGIFVKCAENSWISFESATLPNLGSLETPLLIKKLLKKSKATGSIQSDGTVQFKFSFL